MQPTLLLWPVGLSVDTWRNCAGFPGLISGQYGCLVGPHSTEEDNTV